jgi:PTS system mannose-specific IID component
MSGMDPGAESRTTVSHRARTFRQAWLRCLAIQGSWNYRTMIGTGFAFAILPILRRVYRDDPRGLAEAVRRHAGHFNAHPYLAGMAVGAVGRMEKEGEDPDLIERFKTALRGPLGSLGDRLVWAAWLPATALLALALALWTGVWWVAPVAFLGLYNIGHLTLRTWAYRMGVREGKALGAQIRSSGMGRLADRLSPVIAVLGGLVAGLTVSRIAQEPGFPEPLAGSLVGLVLLLAVGLWGGEPARKWATFVLAVSVLGIALTGVLA